MNPFVDMKIGVINESLETISMLKQEGISFSGISAMEAKDIEQYASILIAGKIDNSEANLFKNYLEKGGAIVFDKVNRHLVSHICPKTSGSDVSTHGGCISCHKAGNGYLIYIDKDLSREMEDRQSVVKEFLTEAGTVRERVALFPKYKNREILSQALMLSFHIRNLPFVRIWYYPASCRSVFNFRFDLDEDTDSDLERVIGVSERFKDCTSWFVSCASFEKNRFKIKKLIEDGFDVQSHGYYHHTYKDAGQNELNIKKSIDYLHNLNVSAKGFVAPKGRWNEGLQMKLERYGFLYSSEFSLDYDNLPFYPVIQNRFSTVLQIPIHPVCWGSYKDAGIENDEGVEKYLEKVIINKYDNRLPALIYGHPSENISKNPKLLEMIYSAAGSMKGLKATRLTDFAKWWSKRNRIGFRDLTFDTSRRILGYSLEDGADFTDSCLNVRLKGDKSSYCGISSRKGDLLIDKL